MEPKLIAQNQQMLQKLQKLLLDSIDIENYFVQHLKKMLVKQ